MVLHGLTQGIGDEMADEIADGEVMELVFDSRSMICLHDPESVVLELNGVEYRIVKGKRSGLFEIHPVDDWERYPELFSECDYCGCSYPTLWAKPVKNAFARLDCLRREHIQNLRIHQVKGKWGDLCIYTSCDADARVQAIVGAAERAVTKIETTKVEAE